MSPLRARDVAQAPYEQGIGALWLGTLASIPPGWEVADGLPSANDPGYTKPNKIGRFARAVASAGDAPGSTGGSASHGHGASASGHTHDLNAGGADVGWDNSSTGDSWSGSPSHTHPAGANATGAYDAESSNPAYIEGIPIVYTLKGGNPSGPRIHDYAEGALPARKIIMTWDGAPGAVPAGWSRCDGATVNGVATPNLLGKFLRGIPNTGTNPGGTGGAASHAHTANHSHATSGPADTATLSPQPGGTMVSSTGHTHTTSTANLNTDAGEGLPEYLTTHYITFTGHGSGAAAHALGLLQAHDLDASLVTARGIVAGWGHPLGEKPAAWGHADGGSWTAPAGYGANKPDMRGRFVKHVATDAGATGGSDTHGHTGGAHGHASGGPSASQPRIASLGAGNVTISGNPDTNSHTHTLTGITWIGNAPGRSTGAASSLPPYQEVAWLIRE